MVLRWLRHYFFGCALAVSSLYVPSCQEECRNISIDTSFEVYIDRSFQDFCNNGRHNWKELGENGNYSCSSLVERLLQQTALLYFSQLPFKENKSQRFILKSYCLYDIFPETAEEALLYLPPPRADRLLFLTRRSLPQSKEIGKTYEVDGYTDSVRISIVKAQDIWLQTMWTLAHEENHIRGITPHVPYRTSIMFEMSIPHITSPVISPDEIGGNRRYLKRFKKQCRLTYY